MIEGGMSNIEHRTFNTEQRTEGGEKRGYRVQGGGVQGMIIDN